MIDTRPIGSECGDPNATTGVPTRIDAHCHSRASDGPAIAALGLIGCPESYSEPEAVYDLCRARGMDLVTLTDHDTIKGALSLAERGFQGVVIGQEVTVLFPEDRCKLHVLVWGITPEQDEQITRLGLRNDVYVFAAWLREHHLAHALAHPLYRQCGRLTRRHLDRCALLFKCFETLNGAHSSIHGPALESYLHSLTPGRILAMVEEQGIEAHWPRVWEKGRTGGSDDHALLNCGRAWTEVRADRPITDGREFFRHVMNARSTSIGSAGHGTLLAHQLTAVGARYFADRVAPGLSPRGRYVASTLLRFAGVDLPRPSKASLALDALRRAVPWRRRRRATDPLLACLRGVIGPTLAAYPGLGAKLTPSGMGVGACLADHEPMADFACDLYDALHRAMAGRTARSWLAASGAKGKATAGLEAAMSYAALELTQAPYLFSLFHQNKERAFVESIGREARASRAQHAPDPCPSTPERPMRVCLFTDTLGDVNGVSRFIRSAADQAAETGRDLRILTSTRFEVPDKPYIFNFAPVLAGRMPKYENLELVLPPVVRMLRAADAMRPDVIHVSTPGPVGLVGLLAARMLRVPVVGTYHTDFPAYIDLLFQDPTFTIAAGKAMRFFYAPFRAIFSRSEDYMASLESLGLKRERMVRLHPGMDTRSFHPRFKDPAVFDRMPPPTFPVAAGRPVFRLLSCGRVSVEKNLPLLAKVWATAHERLARAGVEGELVVVGDGPYRARMEEELRHAGARARFCGFQHGETLAALYASADLFAFPSLTDTLGQVVMESQSSGVPVLVSDQGGPKEMVVRGTTGLVLPGNNPGPWADAIVDLATDHERRAAMGEAAHRHMQAFTFARSFDHFWAVHERVRDHARDGTAQPRAEVHFPAAPGDRGVRTPSHATP
ncbi:MAG: glycosyltransferase [Phycisphaeraceae bacterium]|nr:MAG: glycosyltransferase [Phycisphaeraceae bacterium]